RLGAATVIRQPCKERECADIALHEEQLNAVLHSLWSERRGIGDIVAATWHPLEAACAARESKIWQLNLFQGSLTTQIVVCNTLHPFHPLNTPS
ncbi:Hypothetical predicted protein, partial [Pelobates cultripes]